MSTKLIGCLIIAALDMSRAIEERAALTLRVRTYCETHTPEILALWRAQAEELAKLLRATR